MKAKRVRSLYAIEHATNLKYQTFLVMTYAAGLRPGEVCHLKVCDIDSDRMTILLEQGELVAV